VSGKVPGEAEKWDDVIRKITSVWTPEVAAEVLAAITKLDLRASASVGDVPTFDGSKFVPAAVGGGGSGTFTVLRKAVNYAIQVGDSGKFILATAPDVVLTLPSLADGLWYGIVDTTGGDPAHPIILRPQIADSIAYPFVTLAAGRGLKAADGPDATGVSLIVRGLVGVGWLVSVPPGSLGDFAAE
jgi:hypothetical protein